MKALLLSCLLLPLAGLTQSVDSLNELTAIRFVEAFNSQNYKLLRSQFAGPLKLLFNEKRAKEAFGTQLEVKGKITHYKIVRVKPNTLRMQLRYSRDTTEWNQLGMNFNSKNKMNGISFRAPSFRFSTADSMALGRPRPARVWAMDSLFELKRNTGVFSGCVLVADSLGRMHYRCSDGYDENTVFELASVSKQFTAVAVLQLVAQGKVGLDEAITTYLPTLPYKKVTVRMLLQHTSGLPDYMELFDKHWDKTKIARNSDVVALLAKYKPKPDFSAGKRYEYSNTGYVLLASIVEATSGKPFADYIQQQLFKPLNMYSSRVFHRRLSGELPPRLALGRVWSDSLQRFVLPDDLPNYDFVRFLDGISGDGCVNSTLADLERWIDGLRQGAVLPDSLLQLAWTPSPQSREAGEAYGFGWSVSDAPNTVGHVNHSGSWPGYTTFVLVLREQKGHVFVLSDNDYSNTVLYARHLTSWLLNRK